MDLVLVEVALPISFRTHPNSPIVASGIEAPPFVGCYPSSIEAVLCSLEVLAHGRTNKVLKERAC